MSSSAPPAVRGIADSLTDAPDLDTAPARIASAPSSSQAAAAAQNQYDHANPNFPAMPPTCSGNTIPPSAMPA